MSKLSDEILSYKGSASLTDEEFLEHYGMPRRSGRYPWGSGKKDYQHSVDFLGRIEQLRKKGWKETPENIERDFGMSVRDYRMEKSLCVNERRLNQVETAKSLREKYSSPTKIGKIMGIPESSVRSLLNEDAETNMRLAKKTADFLRERVKKDKMIDVGVDAERGIDVANGLNISRQKFDTALYMLESEGYGVYSNRIPQPTNKNKQTTQKVLCDKDIAASVPPGKIPKDIYQYDKIKSLTEYISRDGGETYEKKFHYPTSIDGKRVKVLLKNEKGKDGLTGEQKDGVIEIRRNVPDLSLGESRYAQVRILVDKNKYLKGMAVYSDNIPDGYDIVFNSNKKTREDAFKKIKNDPDNPFGSAIKDIDQGGQYWYTDKNGKKKLGAINKRSDQGDWTEWKDALPSQFLSKQPEYLAKKQLNLAKANKLAEFEEINSLTNPTIKKHYLEKFAQGCDKAAVDLKAAALPGQKYHVIIPVNSLKDNEIYAPQYKPGTKVALIRYPHGGTFEIPILTVNNKNAYAKKTIGNDSIDAVGITKKVADRLSGADFDGDTVMVIPTHDRRGKVKIQSTDPEKGFKGLIGFDTKTYQYDDIKIDKNGKEHYYKNGKEFKIMKNTNNQMGVISNLITDMTLLGATPDELTRAVKHSMVVIDAEKHKLDYKRSEIENDIASLKRRYQRKVDPETGEIHYGGSSTIISRAKGEMDVPKRRGQAKINQPGKSWYDPSRPAGSLIYTTADPKDLYYAKSSLNKKTNENTIVTTSGKRITYKLSDPEARKKYDPVMHIDPKTGNVTFTNKDGTIKYRKAMRTVKSTRMAETDNAETLMSAMKHPMERLYADYANSMKALANKARLELVSTPALKSNPSAKKTYAKEIASLNARLNEALKNSPKERAALRMATVEVKEKQKADPDMKSEDLRKLAQRSVSKYRNEVGTINRRNRAITISDKEWEAIQAGAISENKLKKILQYTDADSLRSKAMPKSSAKLSTAQINRAKRMADSNFTIAEIAEKMNVSTSTISKYLKGEM